MLTVRVAIALGSNIGDRAAHLRYAIARLDTILGGMHASAFLDNEPQDVAPQPRFLNGVIVGDTRLGASALLEFLLAVERERGRERPRPGAPRTLDLDLVLYGAEVIDEPGLHVPHPRFRARSFVLEPLAEIAPDMLDPVTGKTVGELWAGFQAGGGRP